MWKYLGLLLNTERKQFLYLLLTYVIWISALLFMFLLLQKQTWTFLTEHQKL